MNRAVVDRIANAVLYEGYILYPYRPSVKNRQRWTFGGLYPKDYAEARSDAWTCQCECVVRGSAATRIEAVARFLHLIDRRISELADGESFREVAELRVGERIIVPWQEAEEREAAYDEVEISQILAQPIRRAFTFPGRRWSEPVNGSNGLIVGLIERNQHHIAGTIELSARHIADDLFTLSANVANTTSANRADQFSRDNALLQTFVATHILLGVRDGEFVSMLDPPDNCRAAVAACTNTGVWPVLVGEEGQHDTMLASPIILYDYPEIAPESPGDLFDGAEIDEILTMRILTLTDDEKRQAAAVDDRARDLLARTAALSHDQLRALHGTIRTLRPIPEAAHG